MPQPPQVLALLLVSVCVTGASGAFAQSDLRLAGLTARESTLPSGCRLKPFPAPGSGAPRTVMAPTLFVNPWVGTSLPTLGWIRLVVDGGQLASERVSGPEGRERLAADVVEGYRAVYLAEDNSEVNVAAVLFTDSKFTSTALMNSLLRGQPARIIEGAIVAFVYTGGRTACGRAVVSHIEGTLKSIAAKGP